jgi:hypothetical protein
VLTTSNVGQLKQLATLAVDTPGSGLGSYNPVYAQPLYVAGITVNSAYQSHCNNLTVNQQPACNMLVAVTGYGSIYAWNADTGKTIFSRTALQGTALWNDCGFGSSVAQMANGGAGNTPFGGILSTPVIDPALNPPAMFLTSLCKNLGGKVFWYLHEIDLTNNLQDVANSNSPVLLNPTAPASDEADDEVGATVAFNGYSGSQRSALLEVRNPYATPNPVIYFSFGAAVPEAYSASGNPTTYHGWVFAYTVTGTSNQLASVTGFPFMTTSKGAAGNTDTPLCAQNCTLPSPSPSCVASGYQNSPNWCGHGGGTWMSTRGAAANTLGTGSSQVAWVYYGAGNGAFQTNGQNYGQSILDFRLSQASGADSTPHQSFTTHGGPTGCPPTGTTQCLEPALQPSLGAGCPNETGGNCQYTVETQNANDWDMATSGILLFDDNAGKHRLVTIDKAGYGHLLTQGQVCDPSVCTSGSGQEFTPGDTGDWPFGALQSNLCDTLGTMYASNCHRITSLAFYPGNNNLYFWPYQEALTSLQFVGDITKQWPTSGTITTSISVDPKTHLSHVYANGSSCGTCPCAGTCFLSKVIPGDFLIVNGCDPSIPNACPVITSVQDDFTLFLSFDPQVTTAPWAYSDFFVMPDSEVQPKSTYVEYPGGSVVVTSSGATNEIVWGAGSVQSACYPKGAGALYAYDPGTLAKLWATVNLSPVPFFSLTYPAFNATAGNAAGLYAEPSIVNGNVYVPTFGINSSTDCSTSSPASGIIVFCGPGTTACNGNWQK